MLKAIFFLCMDCFSECLSRVATRLLNLSLRKLARKKSWDIIDYGHIYILPEDTIYKNSPKQGGCALRRVFIWMEKMSACVVGTAYPYLLVVFTFKRI